MLCQDETLLEKTTVNAPADVNEDIRKGSTTNDTVVTAVQPSTGLEENQPITWTSPNEEVIADTSTDDDDDITGTTMRECAAKVVAAGRILLKVKFSVFTIVCTAGVPCVVSELFPRESCSCLASNGCHHIVAARMSIGFLERSARTTVTPTAWRKNKNKKTDKVIGYKRPRNGDVDIVPALDADQDVVANTVNDPDSYFMQDYIFGTFFIAFIPIFNQSINQNT